MNPGNRHLAIVDDDPAVCRAIARLARTLGWSVSAHGSAEALFEATPPPQASHVLLDLHLPGLQGAPLIEALRARNERLCVIVMTGLDKPGARADCLAAGAEDYLLKPVSRAELERLIGAAAP